MKFKSWVILSYLLLIFPAMAAEPASDAPITQEYPALQKFVFEEPPSNVRIGFGVTPFGIIRNQLSFAANLFQFHWINPCLDWEVFSVTFATTLGSDDTSKSRQFVFRTVPKYRINKTFSIGPLGGYEFVTFPDLQSQIFNGSLATPPEGFSSRGWIYGGVLSETFPLNKDLSLKLNQTVYQETYSTTNASQSGWIYRYSNPAYNQSQSAINPGTVFLLEFSILY